MPMFYTPKPRQFHYKPRFYDPEKERWEALKQKYADERMLEELRVAASQEEEAKTASAEQDDAELEYFQRRLRQIDREKKQQRRGLTWKDLFRKREMPTFNYQPRFSSEAEAVNKDSGEKIADFKKRTLSIQRRFDISDTEYMKPIPAGRILLYTALVCILLYWILF